MACTNVFNAFAVATESLAQDVYKRASYRSMWLNMIERWFGLITGKRIRRGTFHNVPQLTKAIMDYIAEHNANPKPFIWSATVEDILAKVRRAREVLDKISSD